MLVNLFFLKEVKEIKNTYYTASNINWIGRYLTDEAKIWSRIAQNTIANFLTDDFLVLKKS